MSNEKSSTTMWSDGNNQSGVRVEDIDWAAMADGEDMFSLSPNQPGLFAAVDPREVRRAETAPMVLTLAGTSGSLFVDDAVEPGQEYRYTEEYHRLYYSQQPRDPRMLPPLTRRGGPTFVGEDLAKTRPSPVAPPPRKPIDAEKPADTAADVAALSAEARLSRYIELSRPDWSYTHIASCIPTFSKDQDGSRLVQRLLERADCVVPIFNEIIPLFEELCTDVFGNYVMQKIMEVAPRLEAVVGLHANKNESATTAHLFNDVTPSAELVQAVTEAGMVARLTGLVDGNLLRYSREPFGCRVMQKAIENFLPADRERIIEELRGHVCECVLDTNANHVVQKSIEVCCGRAQFIVDEFLPKLHQLACNSFGCRVLQRTFERSCQLSQLEEKGEDIAALGGPINVRPILEKVLQSVSSFTIHQYGNYVVQHGILNAPADLRHAFVEALIPQVYALSCSKFASNVSEKVVAIADETERDHLLDELTAPTGSDTNNYLVLMMQDTYANYVVQRLLEACSESQRSRVADVVIPHLPTIDQSVSGRHLLRKMETMGVVSNETLLEHNIDVSGPDYGSGNAHKGGNRGGHHGGKNDANTAHGRGGAGGRGGAPRGRGNNAGGGRQQQQQQRGANNGSNNNGNVRHFVQQPNQGQAQPQPMGQANFQTFAPPAPQTLAYPPAGTYYPQGYAAAPLSYTPPNGSLTPPQIAMNPPMFINGGFNNNGTYYSAAPAQPGYYADPNLYAQTNYFVQQQQQQQQPQQQQPMAGDNDGSRGMKGGNYGKNNTSGNNNNGGRGQRRAVYRRA